MVAIVCNRGGARPGAGRKRIAADAPVVLAIVRAAAECASVAALQRMLRSGVLEWQQKVVLTEGQRNLSMKTLRRIIDRYQYRDRFTGAPYWMKPKRPSIPSPEALLRLKEMQKQGKLSQHAFKWWKDRLEGRAG